MERMISRLMDAASGVVKEGSVTRVMNVSDHFLALLGVAVLHERSTPLSVLSRALLSTHPKTISQSDETFTAHHVTVCRRRRGSGEYLSICRVSPPWCVSSLSHLRPAGAECLQMSSPRPRSGRQTRPSGLFRPVASYQCLFVLFQGPTCSLSSCGSTHSFLWALNVAAPVTMATRLLLLFATSTVETEA